MPNLCSMIKKGFETNVEFKLSHEIKFIQCQVFVVLV
jgi:hypothetical protein